MPKQLALLLSAGALALGVAACGGSSSSSSSASGATTSAAAAGTTSAAASSAPAAGASSKVAIAANPGGMLMFNHDTETAKAGTVAIVFTNDSSIGHNLTLTDSSGKTLAATPTFTGGAKTLTVKLAAGKYTYLCSVPGHEAAGMKGTLTVS